VWSLVVFHSWVRQHYRQFSYDTKYCTWKNTLPTHQTQRHWKLHVVVLVWQFQHAVVSHQLHQQTGKKFVPLVTDSNVKLCTADSTSAVMSSHLCLSSLQGYCRTVSKCCYLSFSTCRYKHEGPPLRIYKDLSAAAAHPFCLLPICPVIRYWDYQSTKFLHR